LGVPWHKDVTADSRYSGWSTKKQYELVESVYLTKDDFLTPPVALRTLPRHQTSPRYSLPYADEYDPAKAYPSSPSKAENYNVLAIVPKGTRLKILHIVELYQADNHLLQLKGRIIDGKYAGRDVRLDRLTTWVGGVGLEPTNPHPALVREVPRATQPAG
jgi:hypothetical protein